MDYYLGVDGGGTKTRFLLCDEKGKAVVVKMIDTVHLHQAGEEGMESKMTRALKEVCTEAGIGPFCIVKAFFGLGGYGEVASEQHFMDDLMGRLLPSSVCGNDVCAAWAGSHAGCPGIQLVAGTGSIAYAVNASQHEARCGGWGHFFGDEGSAYWLAQEMLALFTQESDGRLSRGALHTLLKEKFSLTHDFDLIGIYQKTLAHDRTKIAALAPLAFEAASKGDPHAEGLIRRCAEELAWIAHVAASALSWEEPHLHVSYSGGLWSAGEALLGPLKKALKGFDSRYLLCPPVLSPVAGAVYYAYLLHRGDQKSPLYLDALRQIDADLTW